jgi:membrane protein YqaA with SNARE-associated domain
MDPRTTKEPRMTPTRLAVAGALVLNIPTIAAATVLSAGAVAITAVVMAAIGASLGAVTGWAIATPAEPTAAVERAHERLAA